jgi:hypothetical protein
MAAMENYLREVEKAGDATGISKNKIEQVANDQYVLMEVVDTDNVWTLLGEFSDIKASKQSFLDYRSLTLACPNRS